MRTLFVSMLLTVVFMLGNVGLLAEDQPQWGELHTRNMVSTEVGLPDSFDPETGENVKWSVDLGNKSYGGPVVASGRVLIGADNSNPRDPRRVGDRGVMICLDEQTGELEWQLVVPRLEGDIYRDWPGISICSPATIEGDRAYVVTSRYEVVCLDLNGLADGNDGPYQDEAQHATPRGESVVDLGPLDADILWLFDMWSEAGMYPHDSAHASILLDGDLLYLNSCNGVDNTHAVIRAPDGPSLIVLDKNAGQLIARDVERIGPNIFHSTWSSPAMGTIEGRKRIFFGGGDGDLYAFDAVGPGVAGQMPMPLRRVWRFDCDPTAPTENIHSYLRNRKVSPSNIKSMPVLHEGRIYVTVGGDVWWGKEEAWLKCVDAATGEEQWSYSLQRHCCTTPAIIDGMAFVADSGGLLHCIDIETGEAFWTHDIERESWSSTFVADGKVYIGTRRGDFWTFAVDRETPRILGRVHLGAQIAGTPIAANGVLYVPTLERLFAVESENSEE